jgi:hypothetical protein
MLLTFFLLILLGTLGVGFMALLPVEMRSAQRDRSVVQSAYGADAAVQSVMNALLVDAKRYAEIPLNVEVPVGNGWSYAVESVEQIGIEEFRITTRGSLRGVVQRRAVALIDDGSATEAVKNTASTVDGNAVGAWPATVPIKGDVLWMGTFTVDNGGYNMNLAGNPPFQGTIFQTKQTGSALMKESYTSGNPTAGQYPNLYTQGMAAIQPAPGLSEEDLLNSTQTQELLLANVFGTAEGAAAVAAANAVGANTPAVVTRDGNKLTGGIFINDQNGNQNAGGAAAKAQREFTVRFTAPSDGIGVTVLTRGDGTKTTITTIKANTPLPAGISGPSTASVDRIAIQTSGGPAGNLHIAELLETDIEEGHVLYVDGEITSMQGTFRGNRTIGVRGDTTIDGELLKSDTPRGQEPTADSRDALGIVGTIKASNNSVGTNINITSSSAPEPAAPHDDTYFIYAYLTGLDGNDTNNKLFKQSSMPNGKKVHLIGSLQFAPSNGGLMGHTTDFVRSAFKQVTVDPLRPFGFPGAGRFIPRLRAYVDIPVSL